ncbi:hypothetical protein MM326_13715 [Alkalihalobacillus sp. LMS6]|jgi:hypothetical protein|uniref:hypothetical protein n=1 Tax=Alkalihalobacillus sp. LMS6 TaxID=2924034 RepID=UPI0020CFF056|nr:hypothetical protein [Alkalihalobacillus sp. LMS6]UTR05165.1 hypothetical protein MM326_13715 [Alkalihalobacillus sp. LMS6]
MTVNELIAQTSEQHNVSYDQAAEAFERYHGSWSNEKVLEAIGVLGDGGIHGERVGRILTLISEGNLAASFQTLAARCLLYDAGIIDNLPRAFRDRLRKSGYEI